MWICRGTASAVMKKKRGALKQLFKLCTAFWLPMLINSWKIARNYEDDDDDDDFT